jgi:mannitol/fructose-specific phosphotransferase system IIA component (Ntr-type)
MNIDDFPDPYELVHDLRARDRWQAISELMDILVSAGKVDRQHRSAVEDAVKRRETMLSTAVGSGIGIPHALTHLIKEPVVAFGRSKSGIRFDAHDNKPVFKVALFLVPKGQFQKHVFLLAKVTKVLAKPDF